MNLLRHLGPRWVAFRVRHGWRRRSGFYERRSAARQWDEIPWLDWCGDEDLADPETYLQWRRGKAPPFLFSAGDFPGWRERLRQYDKEAEGDVPTGQANRIASGTFPHYSVHWLERGNSPDWRMNPFTGEVAETDAHWSKIADKGMGDIKHIWELSRFAWVYPLVRAFARDGDPRHAETFWSLLDDWIEKNPPNTGVNWMCGQETSIRLIAWCFGLYAFLDTAATTPERLRRLALAVAQSARRVEANLGYALSQKNNHGMTECAGLITAALLFPEMRRAKQWKAIGLKNLRRQVKELFYPDGSFSQHSPNYERLALQTLIWLHQLMAAQRFESDGWLQSAIGRGGRYLFEICQIETGGVPNTGGNDGSLLLPLSNCTYNDFRPVIQSAHVCGHGRRVFGAGPWDEELFWIGMSGSSSAKPLPKPLPAFDAPDGGTHTIRYKDWTVIARAPIFRHRPAHADLLHVDLWWKGKAVAVDAGTYAYRADPPFEESFRTTGFHNTVEVDGISQMEPVGRFMLLPWVKGRLVQRGETKDETARWMILESDAYRRLKDPVSHRRAVIVEEGFVAVVDWMVARQRHRYRLQWLLDTEINYESDESTGLRGRNFVGLRFSDGTLALKLNGTGGDEGLSILKGDEQSARGWRSRQYMEKEPVASLVMEQNGCNAAFVSVFSAERIDWEWVETGRKLKVGSVLVELGDAGIKIG